MRSLLPLIIYFRVLYEVFQSMYTHIILLLSFQVFWNYMNYVSNFHNLYYPIMCFDFIQLSFKKGDKINILKKTTDTWWWAKLDGCYGYVPVNHLKCDKHAFWQDEEYFGNYGHLVSIT